MWSHNLSNVAAQPIVLNPETCHFLDTFLNEIVRVFCQEKGFQPNNCRLRTFATSVIATYLIPRTYVFYFFLLFPQFVFGVNHIFHENGSKMGQGMPDFFCLI